jgi:hypothetical protein
MAEPNCEGHPPRCYQRRQCDCSPVPRWYMTALFCFLGLIIGIILHGCAPRPPNAPIKAPPPGYGKRVV